MGSTTEELRIKITADTGNLKSELNGVNDSTSKLSASMGKIGGVIAGAFAGKAIIDFGKDTIAAASDVQEMENKFNVVFGELSDQTDQWATDFADSIGANKNQIKTYLADNENMFVGMGMTRDAGAELSENLVQMALDLASFNNLNEDDAVNAMSKAVMGESEAAKSLGAVLNDNTRALAMEKLGYEGKFDALTESEKQQVNYQAIVMQSTDAIGDAERSLGSYVGRQKQFNSKMEAMKEKIGAVLLPIATLALEIGTNLIGKMDGAIDVFESVVKTISANVKPVFEDLVSFIQNNMPKIKEVAAEVFEKVKDILGVTIIVIKSLITNLVTFVDWFLNNKAIMAGLAVAFDVINWAIGLLIEVAKGLVSAFFSISQWISENQGILSVLAVIVGSIATAFGLVYGAIALYTAITTAAVAITTALSIAGGILGGVIAFILSPIGLVIAAIAALIAIGVLLYKNWDKVKATATEVWNSIVATYESAKASIIQTFNDMMIALQVAWENIVNDFEDAKTAVIAIFNAIYKGLAAEWSRIVSACTTAKQNIINVFNSIKTSISNAFESIKKAFTTASNAIIKIVSDLGTRFLSNFTSILTNLKNMFTSAISVVNKALLKIRGFLNFQWSFPSLKMPHFSVSGSINPIDWLTEGVPHIGVEWYARGGIFKKPTVLGGVGVGDASNGHGSSPEVVAPLDDLKQMLGLSDIYDTPEDSNNNYLTADDIKNAFKAAIKESDFGDTVLAVDSETLAKASNKGNKMLNRRYNITTI